MRNEHNKRGCLSKCDYGYITEKGYRRVWDTNEKRYRLEHNIIWEQHYGKIPKGMHIHHRDFNKLNNDISNLVLVDYLTHKRIHSGCIIKNGVWWKPCCKCGELKPITEFYKRTSGVSPWCKTCCKENATLNKRKRRLLKK